MLLVVIHKEFPQARVYVEMKATDGSDHAALIDELARTIHSARSSPHQVSILSFDPALCAAAKRALPHFAVLLIAQAATPEAAVQVAGHARRLGLDGVDLAADLRVVTAEVVCRAHRLGLFVATWVGRAPATNDTYLVWRALAERGVDMFTSNLPRGWRLWPLRARAVDQGRRLRAGVLGPT